MQLLSKSVYTRCFSVVCTVILVYVAIHQIIDDLPFGYDVIGSELWSPSRLCVSLVLNARSSL